MKQVFDELRQRGKNYFEELKQTDTFPLVRGREVLFLYDASTRPVKDVRLVHHVTTLDRAPKLEPVSGNGLRLLHLVLPSKARLEYTFGIQFEDGGSEIITDPLNPLKAWCPFGPKSVVTTGEYKTPEWAVRREGIATGTVTTHTIDSVVMKSSRTVCIYVPSLPPPVGGYPVLVIHDGTDYLDYAGIATVFDNLMAEGKIEPFIAVLSRPIERNDEYTCTPGHAAYVVTELLPWVRRTFPVSSSRTDTGIMGSSFGAVASVYAAHQYPEIFGKLLIQSGSFRFQDIVSTISLFDPLDAFDRIKHFLETSFFPGGPAQSMRIYQSCGTFEPMIGYNRLFARLMKKYGHSIIYRESHDGHNWISWRDHLGDGLVYLFPPGRA